MDFILAFTYQVSTLLIEHVGLMFAVLDTWLSVDQFEVPNFIRILNQCFESWGKNWLGENKVFCQFISISNEDIPLHRLLPLSEGFKAKKLPKEWYLI